MAIFQSVELLALDHLQSVSFQVLGWEDGELVIHPKEGPLEKRIRALRLFLPEGLKETGPPYWDVTSGTLIAQLIPYLNRKDLKDLRFSVTKVGVAPAARFALRVSAATPT